METPNLYLAIRTSSLQLVLALASGTLPKFPPTSAGWEPATTTAATIKAPVKPS